MPAAQRTQDMPQVPPSFEVVILEEPISREQKTENKPPAKLEEKVVIQPGDPVLDPPPDGGTRAWLCVLGCHLALFSTFGTVNAYVRTSCNGRGHC
ncbi:hypothetical protein OE88DRAFT_1662702 [Heliocybe sulcata]|uniref:Uncharacterized protein n=1 Tax=Heliocybe sulcata TaxID=5364 RepID=A0A5C3MWC7_9AGAM|nr:hypothetical protein OE88DRAFT_1662702 [Heliocybe sulcata]